MALPEDVSDIQGIIAEKGEFMLGICEQCMGETLNSRQKSIIDRCVRLLYQEIKEELEDQTKVQKKELPGMACGFSGAFF